jgi:hypothetical protein
MSSIKYMDARDIKAYTKQLKFYTDRQITEQDIVLITKIVKDWISTQKDLYFKHAKTLLLPELGFSIFIRYK